MPNGRRDEDRYNQAWCQERKNICEKARTNLETKIDEITGPLGHMNRLHDRINKIWYVMLTVVMIGLANIVIGVYL